MVCLIYYPLFSYLLPLHVSQNDVPSVAIFSRSILWIPRFGMPYSPRYLEVFMVHFAALERLVYAFLSFLIFGFCHSLYFYCSKYFLFWLLFFQIIVFPGLCAGHDCQACNKVAYKNIQIVLPLICDRCERRIQFGRYHWVVPRWNLERFWKP